MNCLETRIIYKKGGKLAELIENVSLQLWRRPLKAPPANPRTQTFLVLKCNCCYCPQKTKICNIGGVKNKIDRYRTEVVGPRISRGCFQYPPLWRQNSSVFTPYSLVINKLLKSDAFITTIMKFFGAKINKKQLLSDAISGNRKFFPLTLPPIQQIIYVFAPNPIVINKLLNPELCDLLKTKILEIVPKSRNVKISKVLIYLK